MWTVLRLRFSVSHILKWWIASTRVFYICRFKDDEMTQFSLSSSNNHLAKSHQKATHILRANKMKASLGLSRKMFYGSSATNVESQIPMSYML